MLMTILYVVAAIFAICWTLGVIEGFAGDSRYSARYRGRWDR